MTAPNIIDYTAWIRTVMGVTTTQLPDNSPSIQQSFDVAMEITSEWFSTISPLMYSLAVYNLGGDRLINYAQDQIGQTFFSDVRKAYGVNNFVAGVIQSAGDEGTNESMLVPEFMKGLTFMDLSNLKTPYGRQYLAIAQSTGTIWGMS